MKIFSKCRAVGEPREKSLNYTNISDSREDWRQLGPFFWWRLRRQPKEPSAQGHDVWFGNKVNLNKVSKPWQDPTSPRSISWGFVLQSAAQRWYHRPIQEEPGKQLDLVIFTGHSCHWYCASRSYETYPESLSKRNPHLLTSDGQWLLTFVILSNLNENRHALKN